MLSEGRLATFLAANIVPEPTCYSLVAKQLRNSGCEGRLRLSQAGLKLHTNLAAEWQSSVLYLLPCSLAIAQHSLLAPVANEASPNQQVPSDVKTYQVAETGAEFASSFALAMLT